ncbi:DNA mismatch repair endonuclease MutL [bacterium]|nr:DNA mismatch repair endonuclease MutL [bacterium]
MSTARAHVSVLAADVANKIAAGEVVERPAAVVKELVENALDADARRIVIEIAAGGRQLVRVADDGTGMSRADAERAVQRHATSKISSARDIDAITTLGFRGEALPSIAAVSHFELVTCDRETGKGTRVSIDGGHDLAVTDAGRPPGTTVAVKNLFYCVPARAKFLKTTATELSHIGRFVHGIALAWPHVGFAYHVDGNVHFDLPPQSNDTPFLDALGTRLAQLRGGDLVKDLLPVAHEHEQCRVTGFTSTWSRTVMTRQELYLFVNRRPVMCTWLAPLVKRAYGTLLAADRYPYSFLFLQVDPHDVDVNIHPAKREVRFGREFAVQSAISVAVMNALKTGSGAPLVAVAPGDAAPRQGAAPAEPAGTAATALPRPSQPGAPWNTRLTVDEWKRLYGREQQPQTQQPASPAGPDAAAAPAAPAHHATQPHPAAQPDHIRCIGQAGDAYLIAELAGARNGIVVVDQHAAHERINYDRAVKAMAERNAPQQALLLPVTARLAAGRAAVIRERLDDLRAAGFSIDEFGAETFKIDAVPAYLDTGALECLLEDIAADFLQSNTSTRVEDIRRKLALVLVCRGSVKFNQTLGAQEMQRLVDELLETQTPWTCPHGRPTMIVIPYDELEKRFGRRG